MLLFLQMFCKICKKIFPCRKMDGWGEVLLEQHGLSLPVAPRKSNGDPDVDLASDGNESGLTWNDDDSENLWIARRMKLKFLVYVRKFLNQTLMSLKYYQSVFVFSANTLTIFTKNHQQQRQNGETTEVYSDQTTTGRKVNKKLKRLINTRFLLYFRWPHRAGDDNLVPARSVGLGGSAQKRGSCRARLVDFAIKNGRLRRIEQRRQVSGPSTFSTIRTNEDPLSIWLASPSRKQGKLTENVRGLPSLGRWRCFYNFLPSRWPPI